LQSAQIIVMNALMEIVSAMQDLANKGPEAMPAPRAV